METLSDFAGPFFVGTVGAVWLTFLIGLHATTGRWGQPLARRLITLVAAGLGLLAWFGVLLALGKSGFFQVTESGPPKVMLMILPPVIAIVVLSLLKPVGKLMGGIPWHWMPALQSFRVGVEAVLFVLAANAIAPKEMSLGGWNYDLFIGLGGIIVAILLAKAPDKFRKLAIAYNFLGMLVLGVVVVTGIGSALGFIETTPRNTFIATNPYVLLPGFLVPMAFFLHISSLRQLMGKTSKQKETGRMFT